MCQRDVLQLLQLIESESEVTDLKFIRVVLIQLSVAS